MVPPGLRNLLRRCLERDSNRRLRDIGDARIEIDELLATGPVPSSHPVPPPPKSRRAFFALAAMGLAIAGVASGIRVMAAAGSSCLMDR